MTTSPIILIWVLAMLTIISANGANTQPQPSTKALAASPGPGTGSPDCMTLIYNMSDCLTYVELGSNVTKPDKQCCPELAGMLDSNAICLCHLLGKSKDFPVELDTSKAMKLPTVCGLQTPPSTLCKGILSGGPAGAPASSPGLPSSGETSSDEPSPGKNEASNSYFSRVYLVAALVTAVTLLTL